MANKDGILDAVCIQHFINGIGKEIESVLYMRLITLPVARQVDEYKLQVFGITEGLKLLFPCVHVTAEAMNKTDGLSIRTSRLIPYYIMYANTIVDSYVFRIQFAERLRQTATVN